MRTKRKVEAFIVLSLVAFVGVKGYLWSNDTTLAIEKDKIMERMGAYAEEKKNEALTEVKSGMKKGYDAALNKVGLSSSGSKESEKVAKINPETTPAAQPEKLKEKEDKVLDKGTTANTEAVAAKKDEPISPVNLEHYTIKYKYDHTGAPDDISRERIMAILQKSSNIWERSCGVKFEYIGDMRSDYVRAETEGTSGLGYGIIRWSDLDADRLAQAHLGGKNGPVGDFIMDLNATLFVDKRTQNNDLESTFTHELGHVLGLDHSRIPNSVMAGTGRAYTMMNELNAGDKEMCQSTVAEWSKNPRNKKFKS